MQKYITADGTVVIGHAALPDIMKDIIVDMIGPLVSSVIGYFSVKHSRRWLIPALTNEADAEKHADVEAAAFIGTQEEGLIT